MSELTNIHARSVKDLTTPSNLPADPDAFDQIKLVAGNFPSNYAGNEAITVGMLRELAAEGREEEIEEIIQRLNNEEKRAIEAELLLTRNKADNTYVDSQDSALMDYVVTALSQLSTQASKFYPTLAEANADIANLEVNQPVQVGEDANGGLWYKATAESTTLTKSQYDSLTLTKAYVDKQIMITRNSLASLVLSFHIFVQTFNEHLISEDVDNDALVALQEHVDSLRKLLDKHENYISGLVVSYNKLVQTVSDIGDNVLEDQVQDLLFQHIVISALADLDNKITKQGEQFTSSILFTQQILTQLEADTRLNNIKFETALTMLSHVVTEAIIGIRTSSGGSGGTGGSEARNLGKNLFELQAPQSITIIDIETEMTLPVSKDQGTINGKFAITVDGVKFSAFTEFGVQGSSSAGFPKKNWSFDLFTDPEFQTEASLKIGRVMGHSTWVFKANWIDHIQVRMMSNYNLWAQVMDTRKGYPKRDIDHTYVGKTGAAAMETGATGHPIQYPTVVYINGSFYGVGCIGIGKKRGNYNIAKNNQNQIHFDIGGITSLSTLSPEAIDVKAPSTWGAGAEANKQRWLTFANLPQADFTAQKNTYLDKNNVVDYYCFADFLAGADFVFKNLQFITWDGTKWFIMPYDLDMTYGLDFDGTTGRFPPNFDTFQGNDFWAKVYVAYRSDIEARYAELRRNGLFTVDHIYKNMKVLMDMYPSQLLELEYQKWPLPSLAYTSFPDVMEWVKQRIVFLDNKFNFSG